MSEQDTLATEATNSDEEVVLEETTDTEDVVTLTKEEHAELMKRAEQVPNVVARAKKAEAEAKSLKEKYEKADATQVISNTLSPDDVDVKILQSQGMSEDLITEAKAIAKVRNISILAAQSDPIFLVIKEKKEAEEKNAKASLGASRGSGQIKPKKTPATPNLSEEEHRNLWRKANGLE